MVHEQKREAKMAPKAQLPTLITDPRLDPQRSGNSSLGWLVPTETKWLLLKVTALYSHLFLVQINERIGPNPWCQVVGRVAISIETMSVCVHASSIRIHECHSGQVATGQAEHQEHCVHTCLRGQALSMFIFR